MGAFRPQNLKRPAKGLDSDPPCFGARPIGQPGWLKRRFRPFSASGAAWVHPRFGWVLNPRLKNGRVKTTVPCGPDGLARDEGRPTCSPFSGEYPNALGRVHMPPGNGRPFRYPPSLDERRRWGWQPRMETVARSGGHCQGGVGRMGDRTADGSGGYGTAVAATQGTSHGAGGRSARWGAGGRGWGSFWPRWPTAWRRPALPAGTASWGPHTGEGGGSAY